MMNRKPNAFDRRLNWYHLARHSVIITYVFVMPHTDSILDGVVCKRYKINLIEPISLEGRFKL